MSKDALDLTEGPVVPRLLQFTLPIFLGNFFQQLYNVVDSMVVGNFSGPEALAAVSTSGTLIFMMVGFFNGLAVGAGVVISNAFGARDVPRLRRAVHTDIAFGLAAGAALTVFAVLFTPKILEAINVPEEILPLSKAYFRVYSSGILFSVMYNILMGIMNAVGDSRHPLYYLLLSSAVNILLDLLFVAVMGLGVSSVAFATILSQGVSAVLCFIQLLTRGEVCRVRLGEIRFHRQELLNIIRFGLPAGLQNSLLAIGNTLVQRHINSFGAAVMAGFGVYSKLEGFILLPMKSLSLSLTTYVGQNTGARQYERTLKGVKWGYALAMGSAEVVGTLMYLFAPQLIALFTDDSAIIAAGVRQCRIECFLYFLPAFTHATAGTLRGVGRAVVPTAAIFVSWCVLRNVIISLRLCFVNSADVVYTTFPITWTLSCAFLLVYMLRVDWLHAMDREKL